MIGERGPETRRGESPVFMARVAGVLYAIITVTALFAELGVRGRLVTLSDPERTIANITSHQTLYRLGAGADLTAFLCDVAVAILLFRLLRPAGRTLSAMGGFFRLAHATIGGFNTINFIAPLILLSGGVAMASSSGPQSGDAIISLLRLHGVGYNIALLFFGAHCVVCGYLIVRSTFLPRVLGVLLALAGLCYLINSYSAIIAPDFKRVIYPYILLPAGIGEWSLMLWLLLGRVNRERWSYIRGDT